MQDLDAGKDYDFQSKIVRNPDGSLNVQQDIVYKKAKVSDLLS